MMMRRTAAAALLRSVGRALTGRPHGADGRRRWDDRAPGANYSLNNFVADRPRLPIGHLLLSFAGPVVDAGMRLVLWDAEVLGEVNTTLGTVRFRALASSTYASLGVDVLLVELNATGGERPVWQWIAEPADSTWSYLPGYVRNPPPQPGRCACNGAINVTVQMHLSGTSHATAMHEADLGCAVRPHGASRTLERPCGDDGNASRTVLRVAISNVGANGAADACGAVAVALAHDTMETVAAHRAWWHAYYPRTFLTLTDSVAEAFYWIQMYKLASATREDRPVYDLQGPWFIDGTPWPDLHWDLNVQLTYYPLYTGNRLDLARSLVALIDANRANFVRNVPARFRNDSAAAPSAASALDCLASCYWDYGEDCLTTPPTIMGNLLWTLHLYHRHYRYSLNASVRRRGAARGDAARDCGSRG